MRNSRGAWLAGGPANRYGRAWWLWFPLGVWSADIWRNSAR